MAVYDEWEAANEKVAALSLDALTHTELLELQHRREVVARSLPATDHQIINRLVAEADPKALGGTSWADVLSTKLGISKGEARKRVKQAGLLAPRRALTGEPLPPKAPNVAAAQARGQIGAEHVKIIEKFFADLPGYIDGQTRDLAEADLARIATGLGPAQFRQAADRLAFLLNQDGDMPDDADRARRRYLTIEKQQADGMSRIHGLIDPECRATVEAVLAKWAAPGMCNPDDEARCVDGEPSKEAAQGEARSPGALTLLSWPRWRPRRPRSRRWPAWSTSPTLCRAMRSAGRWTRWLTSSPSCKTTSPFRRPSWWTLSVGANCAS